MNLATYENVESALTFISPDLERDEWVKIGMAVKDGLNGEGFEVFDEWSKGSDSYKTHDTKDTWRSIKGGGVTVGTLFYLAGENGWKPDTTAEPETDEQRLKRETERKAKTQKEARDKATKAKQAIAKVETLVLNTAQGSENHPYLIKKNVKPENLREIKDSDLKAILGYMPKAKGVQLKGQILIAVIYIEGKVSSAEFIDESGRKSAIAGGVKNNGYWSPQPIAEKPTKILLGEGIATILSVKCCYGVGLSVSSNSPQAAPLNDPNDSGVGSAGNSINSENIYFLAALSASNLPKVARFMRGKYPDAEIIILADVGNGQSYAEQAARENHAYLAIPSFTPEQIKKFQNNEGKNPTDFNDYHQLNESLTLKSEVENNKFFVSSREKGTLHTLSSNDKALNIHQNSTKPTPEPTPNSTKPKKVIETGVFVYVDEGGKAKKVIESKAAIVLAELMDSENYAYNSDAFSWHNFNGHCWQPLRTAIEPERVILQAMFKGTEPIGFKQAYFSGVLAIMLRAGLIPLPQEQAHKIPFKNGLFDIKTKKIEKITKKNAFTWAIPHDYHNGLDCPNFKAWINSATDNDSDLVLLLCAYINACLVGRADLQKFLHLLGAGGTGKSTFIRLLFAILGQSNCITTDLMNLEQNRFETATIYGKRLTAITDSDKYGGSVNVLKALTGQDPIRNEKKNIQMGGTYMYEGMVLIASNEPLASTDYTSGLERRRLVVKFDHRIKPEEKAAFIKAGGEDMLHKEIPAIINWALTLTDDQVTHIFMHPPQKANEAAFESLMAQNPIAEWISDNLIPDANNWVLTGVREESRALDGSIIFEDAKEKLYPNYLTWCLQNKREALSLRRFKNTTIDMLKTMGADIKSSRRSQGAGIAGIKIKHEFEKQHNWVV